MKSVISPELIASVPANTLSKSFDAMTKTGSSIMEVSVKGGEAIHISEHPLRDELIEKLKSGEIVAS